MSAGNGHIDTDSPSAIERVRRLKLHLPGLLLSRGASFAINLLIVPLSLQYLGVRDYGIWITLSSITGWVGMLDVGIGNGLRNKAASAFAAGDLSAAKAYISTAYVYLGSGAIALTLLFEAVNPFIDWAAILNAPGELQQEIRVVAGIVFGIWGFRLFVNLITSVLQADQRPAFGTWFDFLSTVLIGLGLLFLSLTEVRSIIHFGIVSAAPLLLVPAFGSAILFFHRYRKIRPAVQDAHRTHLRVLISQGTKFFVLQIAVVIQFTTANIIAAQLFAPQAVSTYTVAMKYYSIPLVLFSTLLAPFWSAYTDAFVRNEQGWIVRSMIRLRRYWFVLVVAIVAMTLVSEDVYRLWVGEMVTVDFGLSISLGVYVAMQTWCSIYVNLLNGTGYVLLQVLLSIVTTALFVPLAIFNASYLLPGVAGIVATMCLLLVPSCILWPIQAGKILNGSAIGLWRR